MTNLINAEQLEAALEKAMNGIMASFPESEMAVIFIVSSPSKIQTEPASSEWRDELLRMCFKAQGRNLYRSEIIRLMTAGLEASEQVSED